MSKKLTEQAELSKSVLYSAKGILSDFYLELCKENLLASRGLFPLLEDYLETSKRLDDMLAVLTRK